MDSTTLTYLGLALALIALPFTWLVSRHYATRRNRISYFSRVTRLVSDRGVDGLSISWRNAPVADPHLVYLSLLCRGPRDISPNDIRAGHIRCDLGVPVLGVVGPGADGISGGAEVVPDGSVVSFAAQALINGRESEVVVIVDGEPAPAWDSVVLNATVYDVKTPPVRWGVVGLLILVWLGGLVVPWSVAHSPVTRAGDAVMIWLMVALISTPAIFGLHSELRSVLPRRDRRVRA